MCSTPFCHIKENHCSFKSSTKRSINNLNSFRYDTCDLYNLNKLLLIRDIQEIAKTYINDDRSYRWIWKNKIADVHHIGYVTFMNYISVPSINAKIDEAIAKKKR